MSERRHVGSTYRLQLNGLGFAGATELVPFLHALGVETCYASPLTQARANSTHGYDVIDPTRLDPSLGTPAELQHLLTELAAHGMGLLVDIVPNHMAASVESRFFADVLRHGRDSEFAPYFDIAWDEQDGKILLPVLGKPLAEVLSAGEIKVEPDGASSQPVIAYFEHRFPVAPGSAGADVAATLANQHYVLADWRVANREINYRRFFDINELIGVRQEDPRVFAETHRLVAELASDPRIVGFRVDHVDGLRDPGAYLERLRELTGGSGPAPVIVVEKILGRGEQLPGWPVEGTTGYEFADLIIGLFIDEQGAAALAGATATAARGDRTFAARSIDARRRVLETLFPHQLDEVTGHFARALGGDGERDVDVAVVRAALGELTTYLEVYRTYRSAGEAVRPEDLSRVRDAAKPARASLDTDAAAALDAIVAIVTGDLAAGSEAWQATTTWQQLTSPVAAKGVEDTAMYDSGHLLAAADVGADPDRPAVSAEDFHAGMARRAQRAPSALSSTSTHDSKRSHDVRCRLAVLSEMPIEWEVVVEGLEQILGAADSSLPDVADRRYVYETLTGVWPLASPIGEDFLSRIQAYLVKSAREAKRRSSWTDPDETYEEALTGFAATIIRGEQGRRLIDSAVSAASCAGATNSLASVLLKATAPGVPDVYQGDDGWFFALVDPDNRSPLDLAGHTRTLSRLPDRSDHGDHHAAVGALLADWQDGAVKQLVVRNALWARRNQPRLFADGRYEPLEVVGEHRDHVVAFARVHDERWAITVVPRGIHSLVGAGRFPVGEATWGDTEIALPPASPVEFTDALTGAPITATNARIPVAAALETLPVALLLG